MSAVCAAAKPAIAAPKAKAFTGLRPLPQAFCKPTVDQKFLAVRRSVRPARKACSALQATSAVEVAQLAGEAGYIFGVASVMFGITLVGLAFGFVLLRVESLVEEGKI
eukprot:scaffold8.g1406.t1